MLKSLVGRLSPLIRNQGSLVLTTLLTAVGINIIAANQYLAVIIPGQMFEKNYINMNLKLKNLSRALEAGGTLTAPLFSWNSSGAFILATLAVSPMEYLPYAFLCYLAPLIVALYAYANITMEKLWNQDRP